MSGMGLMDLTRDLKAMLMESAGRFRSPDDADFARHLAVAARDYTRKRPRTLSGTLALEADRANYPAPADLLRPKASTWGTAARRAAQPWEPGWPGRLPTLSLVDRELWLDPVPTLAQIARFGSAYQYFYFSAHRISKNEDDTTIPADDRDLILVRAAAAALSELALDNYTRPVQIGSVPGSGSVPRNGTPAGLAGSLIQIFERMAA